MYQTMLNRKNSKKGFTLVEVIVVLVILAILAAIMVPAMTGWIDEAKNKAVLVEARSALLACQTKASELYGAKGPWTSEQTMSSDDMAAAEVLADVPTGSITGVKYDGNGQITDLIYSNKMRVTYKWTPDDGGSWSEPGEIPVGP